MVVIVISTMLVPPFALFLLPRRIEAKTMGGSIERERPSPVY